MSTSSPLPRAPESAHTLSASIPATNDELTDELTRLAGHINAAQHRFLMLLAALIERNAWGGGNGIKTPAHWLNYYCGIDLGAAREKVRVAKALALLPQIDAAFASGTISYSKVRAMTRTATPENESVLLNVARNGTAEHVEKLVRQHRRVHRLNSRACGRLDAGAAQHAARELRYHYDDDGMLIICGRFAPEEGAVILKALEAGLDSIMREENTRRAGAQQESAPSSEIAATDAEAFLQKREDDIRQPNPEGVGVDDAMDMPGTTAGGNTPPAFLQKRETGCAARTGQTDLAGISPDTSASPGPEDPPSTFQQKRADALALLAETFLATGGRDDEQSGPPLGNGDKYQVLIHFDKRAVDHLTLTGFPGPDCAESLSVARPMDLSKDLSEELSENHSEDKTDCDKEPDDSARACLEDGPSLPRSTLRRLACDASLVPVLRGESGDVLNIGRKSRAVPPAMRRALKIRDGGCRYPGCCQTRYVDAHHIHHWCDGGETRLDNLVLLCRYHHRLLHEGSFAIENQADAADALRFIDREGGEIRPALYPQFAPAASPLDLERGNSRRGLRIDDRTAVTAWHGERLDYGMAIDILLSRDGQAGDRRPPDYEDYH